MILLIISQKKRSVKKRSTPLCRRHHASSRFEINGVCKQEAVQNPGSGEGGRCSNICNDGHLHRRDGGTTATVVDMLVCRGLATVL